MTAELTRRDFLQTLGAGLIILVNADVTRAQAQAQGRRGLPVGARLHVGQDGIITVMTGKVEVGQGSRRQIAQAAAEELRVPFESVRLIMADTSLTPDDGGTFGSRTTPSTIPAVRSACSTARELMANAVARQWGVARDEVSVDDGAVNHASSGRTMTYAELAATKDIEATFESETTSDAAITPVREWKILGASMPKPNKREIVTGQHHYPSDIRRPDMLYGAVLRSPYFKGSLVGVDTSEAEAMEGVTVVKERDFIGCVAASSFEAKVAVEAIAKKTTWESHPTPSSDELFDHLAEHAKREAPRQLPDDAIRAIYHVAYIQHVPMEPRAAVAEWDNGS
ncbi:MAG: molybdopterin-dependent oxidoreductase, partial [Candidatus Poribacteria bacterium]|nr:molybdopterin-dependent oxidoreductase [Candidatus Poribacteria bacterium]